ncbi:TRAP transporter small permease [Guptibacillus hwajinpoensis]|uniref:TRAP transporter small permease n=1 Tax=Guptibacillus hwajinpoensis TaxID=208199 RepID=UPI0018836D21|nr:TRAP transporter small permease [Pseudalkalibacillus hwajinpoensis]MBF0705129.1 TRAP transporter small permease [Pseudalkalibacillus hwajinpoensis]WLR57842.1 TRAP transporter small permease [Pseudalkalibacillus hwajinpoensis]
MFQKVNRVLGKAEQAILSYSVIFMTLILVGNVISRTVFQASWTFAEETGQFFIIIVTFIGVSYAARKGRHLRMSALFELLPKKGQKVLTLVITLLTSLTLFYLTYIAFEYVWTVHELERVTPALRVPVYLVAAFIPIGFFFGGLQYLHQFVLNMKHEEIILATEKEEEFQSELEERGDGV